MQNLLNLVEQEKAGAYKSLKSTAIVCGLLIVLVLAEVSFIRITVRHKLAPDNLALMLTEGAYAQIPEIHKAILVGAYQSAPIVADNLVQYSLQMLAGVGPEAKKQSMLLTETVLTGVREQGVPAFQKVVLDIYGGIDANQEQLKDEVFVRRVVTQMLDEWQREVQNVVDAGLATSLIDLDTQVKDLFSLSDKDLTKQQRAQKKLLLSSRVLIDRLSDRQ